MAKKTTTSVGELDEQLKTLNEIESAMRKKVEEQLPIFDKLPCAQQVTSTQGEPVLKANPAIQEIRALFRDYCAIVKALKDIYEVKPSKAEITTINAIRDRLKIAK